MTHHLCPNRIEAAAYSATMGALGAFSVADFAPSVETITKIAPALTIEGDPSIEPWPDTFPETPPTTPGAVAVNGAAWNFESKPYATYKIQSGDTLSGLAITYLGAGARWPEIWALNKSTVPNPDKIFIGQLLNMPDEAAIKAKAWLAAPPGERPPNPGDMPKPKPGEKPGATVTPLWMYVAGGTAAAVVLVGGLALATRAKRRRHARAG